MESLFLSYSFTDEGSDLTALVRTLIEAVGFQAVDGRVLESLAVSPGVVDKLRAAEGVVCLLTPKAHQSGWVNAEFWTAVGAGKPVLLVVDAGVPLANPFQGVTRVVFDPAQPLKAAREIAAHLGAWRAAPGHRLQALLLPTAVAMEAVRFNAKAEYQCEHPLATDEGPWHPATLKRLPGGVFVNLPSVPEGHYVRVRITHGNRVYDSGLTPQHLPLTLENP